MAAEPSVHTVVRVAYAQFQVSWAEDVVAAEDAAFENQTNGLCGGAVPDLLFLRTGLHTGPVDVTVERHDAPPPLDESWEDVVEVSCTATGPQAALRQWDGERLPIDVPPGRYRVRYSASGMDLGREQDTLVAGDPVGRYLLQFWPGRPSADRILRQHSEAALYCHDARSGDPDEDHDNEGRWGTRLPNRRLRLVGGNVRDAEVLDLDLTFAVAEADDATHRAVARWAARRAYTLAGLADLPVLAPAMAALRDGRPVPAPFDDYSSVWTLLKDAGPKSTVRLPEQLGTKIVSQQNAAISALPATAEPDSLQAALDSLVAAAKVHGRDYPRLFAELA